MSEKLMGLLETGIAQLKIELPENASEQQGIKTQFLSLVVLLAKWNKAYNLTAVREPRDMIIRHILDSLTMAPYLVGERLLDVGTGPGMPGLPLAILFPEKKFTLLDSNGKKTRFITQAISELGLLNVDVVQSRVEDFKTEDPFATITARAFSNLANIIQFTQHLLAQDGCLLLMKGVYPGGELKLLPHDFELQHAHELNVPQLDAARHLLVIRRKK